jgi:hypothetical protein
VSWQKNTAGQKWHFVMKTLASASLATGVSVSAFVAKDGGALTTVAGGVTSIGGGAYVLSAVTDDTNFNSGLLLFTGVSCVPVDYQIFTQGYPITGANVAASVVNHVSVAVSGLVSTALGSDIRTALTRLDTSVGTVAVGGITETSIATAVWANSTRLLSADVTVGTMKTPVTVATSGIANTAFTAAALTSLGAAPWAYPVSTANVSGSFGAKYQPLLRAEIISATSATVVVSTNATAVSDFYKTGLVYIVDGSGSGQPGRLVASYESSGTRRAFTLQTDLAVVPNAGSFLELVDGIGYTPGAITISGEVSIATSGIRADAFQTAALTSIAAANWAATTRLLTAGVTLASMGGLEVSIATSGIRANALTAAALTSIGAAVCVAVSVASVVIGEVSIATGGIKSDSFASGILPTGFSSLLIDASGRVDVGRVVGSSIAAAQMAQSGQQILNGNVGSGATSVSIPVAALFPVSVWGTNSLVGRSMVFTVSTETTALRGTPAAIVSSSPTVLVVTTINAAPTTGDEFIIV